MVSLYPFGLSSFCKLGGEVHDTRQANQTFWLVTVGAQVGEVWVCEEKNLK